MREELLRYGIGWQGIDQPVCALRSDGYWTPWHIAQAKIEKLEEELAQRREHMRRGIEAGRPTGGEG